MKPLRHIIPLWRLERLWSLFSRLIWAALWRISFPRRTVRTLGLYRVKNEDRWIAMSLERTLEVADEVILLDDHSTDMTREIAGGFRNVTVIRSPFSGLDETRDKNYLLSIAFSRRPRWIVFLDGDEVLTKRAVVEAKAAIARGAGGVWLFRIVYLWNSENLERVDGLFGTLFAPRLFSLFDQNRWKLHYPPSGFGGNYHCGQVPKNHSGPFWNATSSIKHYGYMLPEIRQIRYETYTTFDPNNEQEGNYVHILEKPNRRAPGPTVLRAFAEE